MTGNIFVQLAGGVYRLSSTLTLTSTDSGTNGYSVSWQAAPGQQPYVTGGKQVTSWTEINTTKDIWSASIPSGVSTRDLWVNGARATLASETAPTMTQTSTGYTLSGNALQNVNDPGALEMLWDASNWVQDTCAVSSVTGNSSSTTVTMEEPCFDTGTAWYWNPVGQPNLLENEEDFLNDAGQFAFNTSTNTIYYEALSGQTMNSVDAEVGSTATLVQLNGTGSAPVTNVSFSGITFENTTMSSVSGTTGFTEPQADLLFGNETCAADWSASTFVTPTGGAEENGQPYGSCSVTMPAAVAVHVGRNVSFANDAFTQLGTAGITLDGGTQNSFVTGNSFTDVGGNAIQLGSVTNPNQSNSNLVDSNDLISDNFINYPADEYQGGVGIWLGYTANATVENNDVENIGYSAISVGWGWGSDDTLPTIDNANHVLDNYVINDKQDRQDGGGIYTLGPQPNGLISGNDLMNDDSFGGPLYDDQGSNDWAINNNVTNNAQNFYFGNQNSFDSSNTINVTNTFSTTSSVARFGGQDANVASPTVVSNNAWPSAAVDIIDNAGPQNQYASQSQFATYASNSGFVTTPASFYESNGTYNANGTFTINAAGADVWGAGGESYDQYGAMYVPGGSTSTSTTTVEVDSQQNTNSWAKSGLMIRNSIPSTTGNGANSLGYAAIALTPGNGVTMQWDDSSSGLMNSEVTADSGAMAPIWLRLSRSGSSITGYYSTNDSTWTAVATETLTGSDGTEDVGMFSCSHNAGVEGQATFSNFSTSSSPYATYSSTTSNEVETASGAEVINSAGADIWGGTDQYGAIYSPSGAASSSTTTVEVDSQSATAGWAKAGIMIRNSIAGAGSSLGYAILAVSPGNGVALQWDNDSSGQVNSNVQAGTGGVTTAPIWLKLVRNGSSITGYYSMNDSTWTTVATETLTGANSTEDVGMFATSYDSGVMGGATFSNFATSAYPTFASTTASFTDSGGSYSIDAAGSDVWITGGEDYDQYGAIFAPNSADATSSTTVEVNSQQNTNAWAKAGIMLRNAIPGQYAALGYAVIALTPGNGVVMQWDNDSSGGLNSYVSADSGASGPIWLRLTRSGSGGSTVTGYYSTNDSTWTEVASETLTGAEPVEDVGMFSCSHDSGVEGLADFSNFSITG
jgi:regulation of enolase protein 1 (concanavalin A-like superfamily)